MQVMQLSPPVRSGSMRAEAVLVVATMKREKSDATDIKFLFQCALKSQRVQVHTHQFEFKFLFLYTNPGRRKLLANAFRLAEKRRN